MTISDLNPNEYDSYTRYYMGLVPAGTLHEELEAGKKRVLAFFASIPTSKHDYRYAPGKWTIKDILQHLIDVERIFAYRALRFARKDATALPGFEVDAYAGPASAHLRTLDDLLEEYSITRMSTQRLFKSFPGEALTASGMASGSELSVRAAGFKLVGHEIHHCQVIRTRYHIETRGSPSP